MGSSVAGMQVVNKYRDGLGRVTRGFEELEANIPEFESVAVVKRRECVSRLCGSAEIDFCADAVAEFQVTCNEIGVEVRKEDVADGERVLGRKGDVLVGVSLRVN